MSPRYRVTLIPEECEELKALTRNGKTPAKKFIHARTLLLCDASEDGAAWKVVDVAEALGITSRTIEYLKQRFVEQGLEEALVRKPRTKRPRHITFDGKFEAQLVALAYSEASEGYRR